MHGIWDLIRLKNMLPEYMMQQINGIHIGQLDKKDYAY